jgi:hypothetical protein
LLVSFFWFGFVCGGERVTRFEDNLLRRPVLEVRPNALRVHTLPEERDAIVDALIALRTKAESIERTAADAAYGANLGASEWEAFVSPGDWSLIESLRTLDALAAGVSE